MAGYVSVADAIDVIERVLNTVSFQYVEPHGIELSDEDKQNIKKRAEKDLNKKAVPLDTSQKVSLLDSYIGSGETPESIVVMRDELRYLREKKSSVEARERHLDATVNGLKEKLNVYRRDIGQLQRKQAESAAAIKAQQNKIKQLRADNDEAYSIMRKMRSAVTDGYSIGCTRACGIWLLTVKCDGLERIVPLPDEETADAIGAILRDITSRFAEADS